MNELLQQIERELMGAIRRQVARRRARRRLLAAAALVAGLLLLASVASAVTGVGPAGGLFRSDEGLPSFVRPEPGGRKALLHAGGKGAAGWDLLVYRGRRRPHFLPGVRAYCIALARGDAEPAPRRGVERASQRGKAYGGSTECEYPPTLAARLLRRRLQVGGNRGGAFTSDGRHPPTTPYYGLVLAGARRVTVAREGGRPVQAQLSRPFRLELPQLSAKQRRRIESPRQSRLTRNLPRSVAVRAFIGVLRTARPEVGERLPDVAITAAFSDGSRRTHVERGAVVHALPKPRGLEEQFGKPKARLEATGPDGTRWEAVGLESAHGVITAAASTAPWSFANRTATSTGASGFGIVEALARRTIILNQGTGRPGGRRPMTSYAIYGLARGDVRSIVLAQEGVRVRAALSPAFATTRWDNRELRSIVGEKYRRRARRLPRRVKVRLFLAVAPRDALRLQPQVTLADGRVIDPYD